jgi:hypothetical protein
MLSSHVHGYSPIGTCFEKRELLHVQTISGGRLTDACLPHHQPYARPTDARWWGADRRVVREVFGQVRRQSERHEALHDSRPRKRLLRRDGLLHGRRGSTDQNRCLTQRPQECWQLTVFVAERDRNDPFFYRVKGSSDFEIAGAHETKVPILRFGEYSPHPKSKRMEIGVFQP